MRVSDQGVYYSGGKPYGTGYEMMARIRELEAALEEAKAVAHGRGYQQGKAAGDAFGAAMREHVARLEAENKALREGRGVTVKPLKWDQYEEARCLGLAWNMYETRPGEYNVTRCAPDHERLGGKLTQDEAFALAQADCDRLILSALSPAPVSDAEPMHDDAPAAIIGEIGNQIHNLGCEHQNDEAMRERLSDIASRTWKAARMVSAKAPDRVSVGNVRPDIWASHMCHELRQAGYLVPYERMGMAMQAVARAALAETEGE